MISIPASGRFQNRKGHSQSTDSSVVSVSKFATRDLYRRQVNFEARHGTGHLTTGAKRRKEGLQLPTKVADHGARSALSFGLKPWFTKYAISEIWRATGGGDALHMKDFGANMDEMSGFAPGGQPT